MPSGDPYEDYANGYGPYPGYGAYLFGDDPDQGSGGSGGGGESGGGGGEGGGSGDGGEEPGFYSLGEADDFYYFDEEPVTSGGGGGGAPDIPQWCEGWNTVTQMGISDWWADFAGWQAFDAQQAANAAQQNYNDALNNYNNAEECDTLAQLQLANAAAALAFAQRNASLAATGGGAYQPGTIWDHYVWGEDASNPGTAIKIHEYYSWDAGSWVYMGNMNTGANGQFSSTPSTYQQEVQSGETANENEFSRSIARTDAMKQIDADDDVKNAVKAIMNSGNTFWTAKSQKLRREQGFYVFKNAAGDIVTRPGPDAMLGNDGIHYSKIDMNEHIPPAIGDLSGYQLVAIYHSHPFQTQATTFDSFASRAIPSRADVNEANELHGVINVIISQEGNFYITTNL